MFLARISISVLSKLSKEQLKVHNHILCKRCRTFSRDYSEDELLFDMKLSSLAYENRSYTEYCLRCYYSHIYPAITSIPHQVQRLKCLINKTHYWGVIDESLGLNYARKNSCTTRSIKNSIGNIFWYEFSNPDPIYQGALVLAIVHVKEGKETYYSYACNYNFIFDKDIQHIYRDLKTGFYRLIYRCPIEYVRRVISAGMHASHIYEPTKEEPNINILRCDDKGLYFLSLEDAILYVQREHKMRFHTLERKEKDCDCKLMSRFSYMENGVVVRNPWNLQAITSHFIKNYCYHNKREIYRLTHRNCRDFILTLDPVKSTQKWLSVKV
jgi:hypothetical protein